jgi:hypothetical protein
VKDEISKAQKIQDKLVSQLEEYKAPHVMEYVVLRVIIDSDRSGARIRTFKGCEKLAKKGGYR